VAGFLRGYLGHRFASTKYAGEMTDRFLVRIRDLPPCRHEKQIVAYLRVSREAVLPRLRHPSVLKLVRLPEETSDRDSQLQLAFRIP
jgi:hypothetical protein